MMRGPQALVLLCGILAVLAVSHAKLGRKRTVPLMSSHSRNLLVEQNAASAAGSPLPAQGVMSTLSEEALKVLGPYLTPYTAAPAKLSLPAPPAPPAVPLEPTEYVPEPMQGAPRPNDGNFTNQPYLGGGRTYPFITLPGRATLSPRETAAGTVGLTRPAMIQGLPLPQNTGVSPLAQPVAIKGAEEHGEEEDGELNGSGSGQAAQGPVVYHGGDLLDHPNVYAIYYGCWGQLFCYSSPATPALLQDFVTSLSGSSWLNIVTTYKDANGNALHNDVSYAGSTYVGGADSCYQGTSIDDDGVFNIVKCALDSKQLPWDPKGWYVVLSSAEIVETSGFCSKYCGWHAHESWKGNNVRFGFVGSPMQCGTSCMRQQYFSPNNDPEADGMASILAHEIVETMTDADGNAWYDDRGAENADKCAWQFGKPDMRGLAYVNVGPLKCPAGKPCTDEAKTNGRYWLLQGNWVNAEKGYCSNSY